MSVLEIAATVLIASYAMIGGAFLNAAITSPENCKKILDIALKPGPHERLSQVITYGGLIVFILLSSLDLLPEGTANIFIWLAATHCALLLLMIACRAISNHLTEPRATGQG